MNSESRPRDILEALTSANDAERLFSSIISVRSIDNIISKKILGKQRACKEQRQNESH